MKIFLSTILAVGFSSSLVFAQGTQTSTLKTFEVSKNWKDLSGVSQGTLEVTSGTITLTLKNPGRDDVVVTLPIVEKSNGDCGVTIIKAMHDRSSLDGPKETMIITDLSRFACGGLGPIPATQINYEETGGWTKQIFKAQFVGTVLK